VRDVLVDEDNFIESRAESVFYFGVGLLKEENMLVFFGQFFGVVYEGLLIGFL
jgi:hypothetical protein